MPFDGASSSGVVALQQIDSVLDLLAADSRWCQHRFTTADGRHCLKAAIHAVAAEQVLEPIVLDAIRRVTGRAYWRIEAFNDSRLTTHTLVLRVLHQTRAQILAGELAPKLRGSRIGSWFRSTTAWVSHGAYTA
jgi:hypothetical protein